MKRVGIITFHAAYNYGSMLQAYALQQTLLNLGYDAEIINMRTERQKAQYRHFVSIKDNPNLRSIIKSLAYLPFKNGMESKALKFESFMRNYMKLSPEVNEESIKSLKEYGSYISGSDQIWNPNCGDFSWNYLLDFTPNGANRISYAASMGPSPSSVLTRLDGGGIDKYVKLLKRYSHISVREEGTKKVVGQLLPGAKPIVTIDPTLLLEGKQWNEMVNGEPLVKGKYIFFYNPIYVPATYKAARKLSRATGLKVITSNVAKINALVKYPEFKLRLDAGPLEFLNLIKNAECVIGHSFHLMVFSILFQKKFISINGLNDSRIGNLLKLTSLTGCATNKDRTIMDVYQQKQDFSKADDALKLERERSLDYLKNNL